VVGTALRVSVPDSTQVIDLAGHIVMPGIVGMHNHLFFGYDFDHQQAAVLYLSAGATTIRPMATCGPYRDIQRPGDGR
jgi:imidazolonepropionase-like amidohydrolase